MPSRRDFKVCSVYDTETCNVGEGPATSAYPVLFIVNDLRHIDLATYDDTKDGLRFFRHQEDMVSYIRELIGFGKDEGIVPVVCAYNLMFDLMPLMYTLNKMYDMETCAQSTTTVYTLDLIENGSPVLRFWDTFHLELNGLAAMGKVAGLEKETGKWDYDLIRTPSTPLSPKEYEYASRDVQVIPAYLRYLLESNSWMTADMLGSSVLTKTSLVRRMAEHTVGPIRASGSSLRRLFTQNCRRAAPADYATYALRKASFKGGLTFTSANDANKVFENVAGLDVTSMHHTYINGISLPHTFRKSPREFIQFSINKICMMSPEEILQNYEEPFREAFHAEVRIVNLRPKEGSVFAREGIFCIPEERFYAAPPPAEDASEHLPMNVEAEKSIRKEGWVPVAKGARFAFSKLVEAAECTMYISEVELACICMCYDFDSIHCIFGEMAFAHMRPPDYISLQSNILWRQKASLKSILSDYTEGETFTGEIDSTLPDGLKKSIRAGTAEADFLKSYYTSTVKGMFNSIYGTQAQDEYKPSYMVQDGELHLDPDTVASEDNFKPKRSGKVDYTYGLRIVGFSRLHLLLGIWLLDLEFGDGCHVLGGDTDSIKVSFADPVDPERIRKALDPLHGACDRMIAHAQSRLRRQHPKLAADFTGLGHFVLEAVAEKHVELWNKARMSYMDGHVKVTMAGVPRPAKTYNLEDFCTSVANERTFQFLVDNIGYDCFLQPELSLALIKNNPKPSESRSYTVTDHLGETSTFESYPSIALYADGRYLGELAKLSNQRNVDWLKKHGTPVNTDMKVFSLTETSCVIEYLHSSIEIPRGESP